MLFELEPALPKRDDKRMLSIDQIDGKWYVAINYSSLDLLGTCLRKAQYQLIQKHVLSNESPATLFGKAIHKALEHWYQLPISERQFKEHEHDRAELMAYGHNIDAECQGPLESVRQFALVASNLKSLPENDKRSLSNGIKILSEYFKFYAGDSLMPVCDENGPMVERCFEHQLYDSSAMSISYFGTVDMMARNERTHELFIVDHKTASSLGRDFINRAKPNHQFTGYIWLAQQHGYDVQRALINGIQVAKTKCTFERVVTERTEEDFCDLLDAVIVNVRRLTECIEDERWPMSAPTSCTQYGGCRFLSACQMPAHLRQSVLTRI